MPAVCVAKDEVGVCGRAVFFFFTSVGGVPQRTDTAGGCETRSLGCCLCRNSLCFVVALEEGAHAFMFLARTEFFCQSRRQTKSRSAPQLSATSYSEPQPKTVESTN